jgi:TonB family protein
MVRKVNFVAVAIVALATIVTAQNAPTQSNGARKVTARVAPSYPELARKMHVRGAVKVEAVVKPNGSVKSTRILGGSPVLVEAAMDAVSKWKFEAGPDETTEVVQLSFEPQ